MNNDHSRKIAQGVLDLETITVNTEKPFRWKSGYFMPVYNDYRIFMFFPEYRKLITDGFIDVINKKRIPYDIIAGVESSGISPGVLLAEKLDRPFVYVKKAAKRHGMNKNIEGLPRNKDFENRNVILIEDVVSTGESSIKAVNSIRYKNGDCNYCLSIFSYDFDIAKERFEGKEPFDEKTGLMLSTPCRHESLCNYQALVGVMRKNNDLDSKTIKSLDEWQKGPFEWGINHGFPPELK